MAHASRGRPSPRRLPQPLRQRVLHLARTATSASTTIHLAEKLQEGRRLLLSRGRRFAASCAKAGIGLARKRRAPAHRQRRLRSSGEGETRATRRPAARLAGRARSSPHRSGHAGRCTGKILAAQFFRRNGRRLFPPAAALAPPLRRPTAFYGDRSGIFVHHDDHWTVEEELAGQRSPRSSARPCNSSASLSSPRNLRSQRPHRTPLGCSSGSLVQRTPPCPCLSDLDSANRVLRSFPHRLQPALRRALRATPHSLASRAPRSGPHLFVPARTHRQQRQRRAVGGPPLADPAPSTALQLRRSQGPALSNSRRAGLALLRRDPPRTHYRLRGVTFSCCR